MFERNGIMDVTGVLEYPILRKRNIVLLSEIDREKISEMETDIIRIMDSDICPSLERKRICRNCSYFDFCYSGEDVE